MQRTVFLALAILFAAQSTGATAMADSAPASLQPSFLSEIRLDLAQMVASASATHIGALLTGNADRWNAMHAPAPVRAEHKVPSLTAEQMRSTVRERPVNWRGGTRGTPPRMLERPILPKDAAKLHPPAVAINSAQRYVSSNLSHAPILELPTPRPLVPIIKQPAFPVRPLIAPTATPKPGGIHSLDVTSGSANNTGINPWWTYEEGAIPGVGKYMVNVANGNLIVQADDVDIPERGIDLAFRRTYNSMSGRDWAAADGSPTPGQYGEGWTNTFDAHLAYNTAGGISVFDIDGARYDYTANGTGCLTPPPGTYNTLCTDGGSGFFWTKKTGTLYYFYGPANAGGPSAGYAGRLYRIYARNQNNYVQLNYYWTNGDPSTSANLTEIVAQHSDGQALTLNFAVASSGATLLSSLVRPDGVTDLRWRFTQLITVRVG